MIGREIAPLTKSLSVHSALGMIALVRFLGTSFLMVACLAHTLGIVLGVLMWAVLDDSSRFC